MAGILFAAVTGEVATGTAAKTLLQVVAAANQRVKIKEISVSFKGVSPTDAPILVTVSRQTTAGTMSALTPAKLNESDAETLQTTAQHTATAEPTTGASVIKEEVHPQTGFIWQSPFGGEVVIQGGGKLGIVVTAGVSVSAVARVIGEE